MARNRLMTIVALLISAAGAAMVFVYVNGSDDRAAKKFDTIQVLGVLAPIAAGETIESAVAGDKIGPISVPRTAALPDTVTDPAALSGTVALTNLYPGEQLLAQRFGSPEQTEVLPIPKGKLAISVNLSDPARVAGFVNPGAEVAIFHQSAQESGATTRVLLSRVQVIGVGTTSIIPTTTTNEEGASTTEQLPRTLLTFAVDQVQAQKILHAANNGQLALGLLTPNSEVSPGEGTTDANLY